MMAQTNQTKKFGKTIILPDADSFLDQIDGEDKSVTVIIMIHEPGAEGCEAMTGCIECLAADFPTVKFCSIKSTTAGLSKHFKTGGVPALLVYKGGQVSLDNSPFGSIITYFPDAWQFCEDDRPAWNGLLCRRRRVDLDGTRAFAGQRGRAEHYTRAGQ